MKKDTSFTETISACCVASTYHAKTRWETKTVTTFDIRMKEPQPRAVPQPFGYSPR